MPSVEIEKNVKTSVLKEGVGYGSWRAAKLTNTVRHFIRATG
jgi:predicted transcriptional regulator